MVLDLLAAMRGRGVRYSYAWWDAHPWPVFGGGSVLLIGIVLPVVINLAAFGTVRRPQMVTNAGDLKPAALPAKPAETPASGPEPAPGASPADEKDYGMKRDDYYPTELTAGVDGTTPPEKLSRPAERR